MKNLFYLLTVAVILFSCNKNQATTNGPEAEKADSTTGIVYLDSMTIQGEKSYLNGYTTFFSDSMVNVIVEIPAGTLQKWEVDKTTGNLAWQLTKGKPRIVKYLSYPANYGMIPGTLQDSEKGGDGDPLDVIILGEAIERGKVVGCHIIGVLELIDKNERDDKVIAVPVTGPFSEVRNLTDLENNFPGSVLILETWFKNYKGAGKIEISNTGDAGRAWEVLNENLVK